MNNTMGNRNTDATLGIWREVSDPPVAGTYERIGRIQLGVCGSGVQVPLVTGTTTVYECALPQNERISVQPGDIIGIEIAANNAYRFRLYFIADEGP